MLCMGTVRSDLSFFIIMRTVKSNQSPVKDSALITSGTRNVPQSEANNNVTDLYLLIQGHTQAMPPSATLEALQAVTIKLAQQPDSDNVFLMERLAEIGIFLTELHEHWQNVFYTNRQIRKEVCDVD